jgi:hypothetical protein
MSSTTDPFVQALHNRPNHTARSGVLQVIERFMRAIEGDTGAACVLEPGFASNLGKEWRLSIVDPTTRYEWALLRAHVPADGFPVTLDLFADEPAVAGTEAELEQILVRYLSDSTLRDNLELIRTRVARTE